MQMGCCCIYAASLFRRQNFIFFLADCMCCISHSQKASCSQDRFEVLDVLQEKPTSLQALVQSSDTNHTNPEAGFCFAFFLYRDPAVCLLELLVC